ncbi:beta-lactamase domain protein [Natrialba magadii ATCC 43099]|uniref:Beta-lactamase domain protein n=1 Tax=Natrialba magadii (strain ATCC 43099 / DSM 3394 / CCM 3739 / CIP 104546 / IAM 13178 / JCM 8861 / NBRC 102185 / NCIMB 2190 / MS3) TaxID=547559 RepID=D3SSU6_NATMM|nr:MBL fold metallo-hydrolase [Natrialba magadii]ADD04892.1 beta-lactamase domain protein [Natrialba magadii ATCC 43099]ELY23941.1 RNA-metabolising metallo-beta-lactamase [Natrialba magadii ATCC 43099]
MELEFVGGAREIGRSALVVDDTLLVDFGMDSGNPPAFPIGDVDPEAVVVSHGHLDHVGSIPALLAGDARPPVHWTPPTYDLTMLLARDTLKLHGGTYDCPFTEAELARLTQVSETHGYRETFEAAGYEVTFYDAGHIPGSAHVLIDDGETRLLYTGDFHTEDQQLLSGTTTRPEADVVVCESTYSETSRRPRSEIEAEFVESVQTTLWEGGTVVVPAFAIGRTQEIMCICEQHDLECYVDGMGTRVAERFLQTANREFLRDPDLVRRAKGNARFVDGRDGQRKSGALAGHARRGPSRGQRKRIAEQNTVIITTSGMLHGGPAMTYIPEIRSHPVNKIAMTGYQVEGTPGRDLLDTGSAELDGRMLPVSAQVEQYDFSAHADRDGLHSFLESYRDSTILVNHGDRCVAFADELRADGFDASAPALGESWSTDA